jgi:hypothetical protein|tara:strand:+ start:659 stop:1285 length:627 start_codon:yes stop_codon:yes gene_type:complete
MTRNALIERVLRQIYNGQPSDDSNITYNLVNQWLNDAIGLAAKKNYTDNIQIDGIAYVNNSFYTTFTDITINAETVDSVTYSVALPVIPYALGRNEGVAMLQFVGDKKTSQTAMPLSMNQVAYQEQLRPIQNKILYWIEGKKIYVKSAIPLTSYKATLRLISGGDSTDLTSTLVVPDDYIPHIIEYIKGQLAFEKSRPIDTSNDGVDN